MLQDSLPFALHLSSVSADLDENGPPVMNQIARGGYSPTPPEEDTGVPHASRSQGPDIPLYHPGVLAAKVRDFGHLAPGAI